MTKMSKNIVDSILDVTGLSAELFTFVVTAHDRLASNPLKDVTCPAVWQTGS